MRAIARYLGDELNKLARANQPKLAVAR